MSKLEILTIKDCCEVCSKIQITPIVDAVEIRINIGRATDSGGYNNCDFTTRAKTFEIAESNLARFVRNFIKATDNRG